MDTFQQENDLLNELDRVIDWEKTLRPEPFLSTRVWSRIQRMEEDRRSSFFGQKSLRPVLMGVSLVFVMFTGIYLGSLMQTGVSTGEVPIPIELSLLNDAKMESIYLLTQE